MSLEAMLQQGKVWQAAQQQPSNTEGVATGYQELDKCFQEAGWPSGNLVELMYAREGCGELRLLLPLLARESRHARWLLLVDPPHIPYAPALAEAGVDLNHLLLVRSSQRRDRLWCLEQALKSGSCAVVLGWLQDADDKAIRRLQVAAAEGGSLGFIYRPVSACEHSSAAPYRLLLEPQPDSTGVTVMKRRGGWPLSRRSLALGIQALIPEASPAAGLRLVK